MALKIVKQSELKCTHCGCSSYIYIGFATACAKCGKYFPKTLIQGDIDKKRGR